MLPPEPTTQLERELLDILQEECAELIEVASKVKRFGIDSDNHGEMIVTNKTLLLMEMADVQVMLDLAKRHYNLSAEELAVYMNLKVERLKQFSNL